MTAGGLLHVRLHGYRKLNTTTKAPGFGLFMMVGQAENKNGTLPLPQSAFHEIGKKKAADETNSANAMLIRSACDRNLGFCEWRCCIIVINATSPCVETVGCQ